MVRELSLVQFARALFLIGWLLLQDKIAIARLVYRKRSIPRFVALLPQVTCCQIGRCEVVSAIIDPGMCSLRVFQEETRDAEGFVATPAGFHLIFLPFCDDIRNPQFDPAPIGRLWFKLSSCFTAVIVALCGCSIPRTDRQGQGDGVEA